MLTPTQIVWAIRAIAVLVVVALALSYFHGFLDLIRAPLEAQLDASRANQAAGKAAVDHQNKAVDGLQEAGKKRKAASQKAVEAAGKPELERAEAIAAKPAPGDTPIARAANRINEEFAK